MEFSILVHCVMIVYYSVSENSHAGAHKSWSRKKILWCQFSLCLAVVLKWAYFLRKQTAGQLLKRLIYYSIVLCCESYSVYHTTVLSNSHILLHTPSGKNRKFCHRISIYFVVCTCNYFTVSALNLPWIQKRYLPF